jgi:hypothetical protein
MNDISRRRFLQGAMAAAGAGLLAPGLRFKNAAAALPTAKPRVVIVLEGNGIYSRAFISDMARAKINQYASPPLTTSQMVTDTSYGHRAPLMVTPGDIHTAATLSPLKAFGVDSKSAVVLGLSNTIAGGGHSSFQGGLACARGGASNAPSETIDAVLARNIGNTTPFDALRLGVLTLQDRLSYDTCAYGTGRPAVISANPVDAYNRMFGAIARGASDPQIAMRADRLAFAKGDVAATLSKLPKISANERAKLVSYQRAIEQAQTLQDRLLALGGSVAVPPGPTGAAFDPYFSKDCMDRLGVQFSLATAALIGGLTNVVVLASGPGGGLSNIYPSVLSTVPGWRPENYQLNRHTLQHSIYAPLYPEAILAITQKHVELVSKMAQTLDATAVAGGGTLLDNTLIIFMSDNGEQHHSQGREWPILLIGGKALGMQTDGRTVVFPRVGEPNNRQVSNLWNTVGHATGDDTMNQFGKEGTLRIAPGPLSEIFS